MFNVLVTASGCPKSSQRDAPSSGISLLGTNINQQVLSQANKEGGRARSLSLGQKLLDDCRVVWRCIVVQKKPVTRFTHARSNTSNSV